MSHLFQFSYDVHVNPQPTTPIQIGISASPSALVISGFNMMIEVATASAFVKQSLNQMPRKAIPVMAHFDTGASLTTIDEQLAAHLGLVSIGTTKISTANGIAHTPNYAVDVSFINTHLKSVINLQVNSCKLAEFDLAAAMATPDNPKNFGVLIGRDIMSLWNVVWHGPSSTVLISD